MPDIRHFRLDTDAQTLADAVKEDGAIIIDDVLSAEFITQLRTETDPYMEGSNLGFDDFAGFKTTRTGGLMVRSQKLSGADCAPRHSRALQTLSGALLPNCATAPDPDYSHWPG